MSLLLSPRQLRSSMEFISSNRWLPLVFSFFDGWPRCAQKRANAKPPPRSRRDGASLPSGRALLYSLASVHPGHAHTAVIVTGSLPASGNNHLFDLAFLRLSPDAPFCRLQATLYLNRLLRLQPDNKEAWEELGQLYLETGSLDLSLEAYRRAVALVKGDDDSCGGK